MRIIIGTIFLNLLGLTISGQSEDKWPVIDASPMDVIYYPKEVAWRNYLKEEERQMTPKAKLLYSRPQKNNRDIFGGLVAYGSEWRLGANEATTISFYQPVGINGTTLQAGNYTLWAVVHEDQWTINFSTELGIWGIANRDKDQTVATIKVPVEEIQESTEALSMTFQELDDKNIELIIQWEMTRVRVPISFNPIQFNQLDASQLDIAHYPANSAYTNYLKGDDREIKAKITVAYHRPAKKNRAVFGSLVPYGKIWRLGANESTEILLNEKAKIGDKIVNPGNYGLYAEVNKNEWTLIFSKDIPSWGPENRDDSKDIVKVKIPSYREAEVVEYLSIVFEEKDYNKADMIIAWDTTRAVATFEFISE